jgi:uroporphyrinogen decarboxylase
MNKRQAMMNLLDPAYKPQSVPAAFFLHFDPAFHEGKAAVEKHLEFFRFTGMDLVKIQFEQDMPAQEIKKPGDWAKVRVYRSDFWEKPLAVVKGIVEAARKEAVVLLTLY